MSTLSDLVEARNKAICSTPASFYKALNTLLTEDEQGRAVAEMLVGKNGMPFILNNTSFLASPHAQCIEPRSIFPAFDRLFDLAIGTNKPRFTCVVGGKNGLSDGRTCPANSKEMDGGGGCKQGGWARNDHVLKWLQPSLIQNVPALAGVQEKRKQLRANEKKRRDNLTEGVVAAAAPEAEAEPARAAAPVVPVVVVATAPAPAAAVDAAVDAVDAMDIDIASQPAHKYACSHQMLTIDEDNESWNLLLRYLAPVGHTALFSDPRTNPAYSGTPLASFAALEANAENSPIQRLYRLRSLSGYYQPDESVASFTLPEHSTTVIMQREATSLFLVFYARRPVLLSIKTGGEAWRSKEATRIRPVRFVLTAQSKHSVDRVFYEETGMLRLEGLVALECDAFAGTLMITSHDLLGTDAEMDQEKQEQERDQEDTSMLVHLSSPGKITVKKGHAKTALVTCIPLTSAAHSHAKRNERRVQMEQELFQAGGGGNTTVPVHQQEEEEEQPRATNTLMDDGSYPGNMNHFYEIQLFVVNARQLTWSMNDANPQRRRVQFASPNPDKRLVMRRLVHPSGRVELPLLQINDCVVRVKKVRHQGSGDTDFQYEMLKHSPLGPDMAAHEKQFHALYAQQEITAGANNPNNTDLEALATKLYGPRVESFDILSDFLGAPTARSASEKRASDEVLEQQRAAKRPRLAQSAGKQLPLSVPGKQPRPQYTGVKRPQPRVSATQ